PRTTRRGSTSASSKSSRGTVPRSRPSPGCASKPATRGRRSLRSRRSQRRRPRPPPAPSSGCVRPASSRAAAIATALRHAYAARGDAASVVKLIERELSLAEGDVVRGRLHGEMARVLRDKLFADDDAEKHARLAIEIDPSNADALLVMGDIAFEGERFVEATRHLEPLVGRAATLDKADAVRAL